MTGAPWNRRRRRDPRRRTSWRLALAVAFYAAAVAFSLGFFWVAWRIAGLLADLAEALVRLVP